MFRPLTSPVAWSTMIRNILVVTNWIFSEPILTIIHFLDSFNSSLGISISALCVADHLNPTNKALIPASRHHLHRMFFSSKDSCSGACPLQPTTKNNQVLVLVLSTPTINLSSTKGHN